MRAEQYFGEMLQQLQLRLLHCTLQWTHYSIAQYHLLSVVEVASAMGEACESHHYFPVEIEESGQSASAFEHVGS